MKEIEALLCKGSINFVSNVRLSNLTHFKMGGPCDLYIRPTSESQLMTVIKLLNEKFIDYRIVGNTSNLIFFNEVNYGCIITTESMRRINIDNSVIEVSCGYQLFDLARLALTNNVLGYEGLEGIPATVGGSIFMNASAYGDCISDHLISVDVIDCNNEIVTLSKEQCKFSFRNSIFKSIGNYCLLSAKFKFNSYGQTKFNKMESYHIARHTYQEFTYPNLGSMFSTKGDFYRVTLSNSKFYLMLYYILKLILKNPVIKRLNRKNPSNKIFNNLVQVVNGKVNYPISHKSLNILVNDGNVGAIDIIEHIEYMNGIFGNRFHLENEMIMKPISTCPEEILKRYKSLREDLING